MKVQCPSCGGTGVIMRHQWPWSTCETHQCHKCEGFGFVMMESTEFAKRRSDFRKYGRNPRFLALGECCEFTELAKVRNIQHVVTPGGRIPYGKFYKEHRGHR